ncbi:MAG: hypothetical protein RR011_05020 [Oscillospiraceae bacterium]
MKIQHKIILVNILTVISAILTLVSFSAMQGISSATVVAIGIGIFFADLTFSLVKTENLLRIKMCKSDIHSKKTTVLTLYKNKPHSKVA